ncbi:MAG: hypothetical protein SFW62_09715 [Alphaproteobacteria bacterium]|nr:hypothetical protein [Alphaproteobacteria bacterium]
MKKFPYLLVLILLTALSACASSDKEKDKDAEKEEEKKEEVVEEKKKLPICPQVAIIRELATVRDYGDEKPDLEQLVSVSRMESIEGDCEYKDEGIDIAFGLGMIAGKGPRLGGDHASFSYFIAVVDPEQNILNKDRMSVEFRFTDDKKIAERMERLHVFIPLGKDKHETGPNYQVLLGFQLTQAQLDIVRAKEDEGLLKK